MKKKIIIAVVAVLALGLVFSADYYRNDPNLILKKLTKKINLDETKEAEFDYSKSTLIKKNYIPVYVFTAPEDAEYSFDVTDINAEDNVYISMTVSDPDLNEYFSADNFEEHNGDISGSEFLSKDNKCLIILDAVSQKDDAEDRYTGSLKVTVTKKVEAGPAELTTDEPVTISIGNDEMSSVLFRPAETGLYRFDSSIVSEKKENGFSSVSLVKTADKKEVKVTEGICYLEEGNDYYIWISASELTGKTADVSVSCSKVDVIETDSPGTFSLEKESVISFKPKKAGNYAIYSISEGNLEGAVYDEKGFPVNKNSNSAGTLSQNDKDFALVLQAKEKVIYLVHVSGEFNGCRVSIAEYTGDGTSLGPDDIELPPEEGAPGSEGESGETAEPSESAPAEDQQQ